MKSVTLASVLALSAGLVQADTPNIPSNAQSGLLRFPVQCTTSSTLFGFKNLTLDTSLTATAPLTAQAGQQVLYNDVSAALTVPQNFVQAASKQGVKTADLFLKLNLDLTNAQTSSYAVFPNGYWANGTVLVPTGNTTVSIPKTGVLPAIGPVTVQQPFVLHTIAFGPSTATLYLRNSSGGTVVAPATFTCGRPLPNPNIGLINVLNATNASATLPALSPAIGNKPPFAGVALNAETGCFAFNYSCTVGLFGPFAFQATACGSFSRLLNPGSQAYLSNVQSTIVIPPSVVDATRNLFKNATTLVTQVKTIYLGATNASPAVLNGLASPYNFTTTIPKNGNITLHVPPTGTTQFGPFTINSGTAGLSSVFTLGNSTSAAQIYNSTGAQVGNVGIVCKPNPNPITAFIVPIVSP